MLIESASVRSTTSGAQMSPLLNFLSTIGSQITDFDPYPTVEVLFSCRIVGFGMSNRFNSGTRWLTEAAPVLRLVVSFVHDLPRMTDYKYVVVSLGMIDAKRSSGNLWCWQAMLGGTAESLCCDSFLHFETLAATTLIWNSPLLVPQYYNQIQDYTNWLQTLFEPKNGPLGIISTSLQFWNSWKRQAFHGPSGCSWTNGISLVDKFHMSHAGIRVYLNRWAIDHPDVAYSFRFDWSGPMGVLSLVSVVFTEPSRLLSNIDWLLASIVLCRAMNFDLFASNNTADMILFLLGHYNSWLLCHKGLV